VGDLLLQTIYVPIGRYVVGPSLLEQNADFFAPLTEAPSTFSDLSLTINLRPVHLKAAAVEKAVIPPTLEALSQRLSEVSMPVTIVVGALDKHAFEQAARMDEDIPHSEQVIIEDAEHFLWYAYPDVVVTAVTDTWAWADSLGETAVNE
jgi:pimeloyl-ACP methyl ester carboxylesterase